MVSKFRELGLRVSGVGVHGFKRVGFYGLRV